MQRGYSLMLWFITQYYFVAHVLSALSSLELIHSGCVLVIRSFLLEHCLTFWYYKMLKVYHDCFENQA